MKLKISDMLDRVENIPVDIEEKDIASTERIKVATMKKIHQTKSHKSKVEGKWHTRKWWASVAACLAVAAIAFGVIPVFDQPNISPFVMTAYALEADNSVSATAMQVGESVPVSLFETNNVKGFVFSRDQDNSHQPPSISVIGENRPADILDRIDGMPTEKGKHYVLYVLDQSKFAPYEIMVPYTSEDGEFVYEVYLTIDDIGEGYTAVIDRIETRERIQLNEET